MKHLERSFRVRVDELHAELQIEVGGFWNPDEVHEVLNEINKSAMIFITQGLPFSAMGNMTNLVPQDRVVAAAIRDNLMMGKNHGLQRVAIVSPPVLVRMQYQRLAEGMEVEFFDSEMAAKAWLRGVGDDGGSVAA